MTSFEDFILIFEIWLNLQSYFLKIIGAAVCNAVFG